MALALDPAMRVTSLRAVLGTLLIACAGAACHHIDGGNMALGYQERTEPEPLDLGPHLGESTASPGSDPSRPPPLPPDDPRNMNVTVAIRSGALGGGTTAPAPAADSTVVVPVTVEGPPVPLPTVSVPPPEPPPPPETPTSSTEVPEPQSIAPPSTTYEPNQPGVFSPPPPSVP
jgi:hypothetical protein